MKIWLVGAGYWGSKVKETLELIPNVTDIEIVDVKEGKTINDINTKDPVILATPLWQHHEQTMELLARGHDVYVEKPMAETSAQILDINNNLPSDQILMVGHIFLYNPLLIKLKELIDGGSLGKIGFIESRRLNWGIRQTKTTPTLSLAPHDISILRHLLGDIDVTYARGENFSNNEVNDSVTFGGNKFEAKCSWWWPTRERTVTVIGDRAQAVWNEDDKNIVVTHGFMQDKYPVKELTKTIIPYEGESPLYYELEHFVNCCVTRTAPRSDISNALGVARNIDQVTNLLLK